MPQTRISHSDKLSLRDWDKKVFLSARKKTFWDKLKGVDTSNGKAQKMVEDYEKRGMSVMTDSNAFMESRSLGANEGTEEIFKLQIINDSKTWIKNDNLLEGHEIDMNFANQAVIYDIHKFGVNRGGSKTKVETDIDLVQAMHTQVTISTAEKLDALRFEACKTVAYSNTATLTGSTIAGRIGALVDIAQTGKGIEATGKIVKPVKIGGEDYYVLGMSIADARLWRNSAEYGQAQREANERGAKNPIFTGSLGIYENVIIMKHSDFEDGKSVLMGSQAMLELWGGDRIRQIVATSKYGKIESETLGVFLSYGVAGAKFSDGKAHGLISAKVTN